jgi:hypothetical protein
MIPIPPSAEPGRACVHGVVSPVPTKTVSFDSSSGAAGSNRARIAPLAWRCAGRVMPGVSVAARPPTERHEAPASDEYQTPPFPVAA